MAAEVTDKPRKTTHAQRRRSETRNAMREKLQSAQYIRRLHEIAEKASKADAADVPALRLKADIYCRLLAKCLPDLKAVEHSGEIAKPHYVVEVPAPCATTEEWVQKYAPPALQ